MNKFCYLAYTNLCTPLGTLNAKVALIQGGYVMTTEQEARNLEITLIKLMETQSINKDDYNLIHKYLIKIHNDLKLQTN